MLELGLYYCHVYVGVPRLIRTDCGTDNTVIAVLQPFLRRHGTGEFSGEGSFQYGKSTSNQVIMRLQYVHQISISFVHAFSC